MLNVDVTTPEDAVESEPAVRSDRVNLAVTLALSTSLTTISIRFRAVSSV
jgi:hypothetical protein